MLNSYEIGLEPEGESTLVVAGWSDDVATQGLIADLPASQQWFHVAATLTETRGTLYIDGEIAVEQLLTVTPAFDDNDLYIGADMDNKSIDNFFLGRIDDLRIYRRALSIDEVALVMAGENL